MLSISELFRKRKKLFLIGVGCVVCVFILFGVLHANPFAPAGNPEPTASSDSSGYQATVLRQFKSKYVGDHVNVGNLLRNLPYAQYLKGGISLQTENTPYGINVNYDFMQSNNSVNNADDNTGNKPDGDAGLDLDQVETTLRNNAAVIFALIDNVDIINITADPGTQNLKLKFTRTELQKSYPRDLRDYAKTQGELQILLNSIYLKILVYPQKYALTMSSTPGIRLLAQYEGAAGQVQYSADNGNIEYSASGGQLLTWDNADGKITEKGIKTEFPPGTPAYWSPLDIVSQFDANTQSEIPIAITVSQNGIKVAEKQVIIYFDGSTAFFTVEPSGDVIITDSLQLPSPNPDSIAEAVSRAIKSQGKSYLAGEAVSEGHIILDTEEKNGQVKVYTMASIGWFGFENGIFTMVSGSGAIPTVMTFSKNKSGTYVLHQYQEPQDGAFYLSSVKKMFPPKLWPEVLTEGKRYPELVKQKEEQAAAYLKSIGREAKVSAGYVEKTLVDINVQASNKLLAMKKYNSFLNSCPYWSGSREEIKDGIRYIYETSQSKTGDGYDLIIFQKKKENGSIVMESKYKIVENEPRLIEEKEKL